MTKPNVSTTSPLITREFHILHRGRDVTASFRPGDYRWHRLASQLADALLEKHETLQLGVDTLRRGTKVLRDFLNFIAEDPAVKPHGIGAEDDFLSEAIYRWSDSMALTYAKGSQLPRQFTGILCGLIMDIVAADRPVGRKTLARAAAGSLVPGSSFDVTPLVEFSNKERIALRDAARQRVRAVERRLRLGSILLTDSSSRYEAQYPQVGPLLRQRGAGKKPNLAGVDVASIEWPPEVLELDGQDLFHANKNVLYRLDSMLYPFPQDMQAFRILLLQTCGWAPEEIHDLLTSETEEAAGGRHYTRKKARAGSVKEEFVANGRSGEWDFNGLIDRLLAATQRLRAHTDVVSRDFYFLSAVSKPDSVTARVPDFNIRNHTFTAWVESRGLEISRPYDIRRLRKTARTIRAVQTASIEDAAGDEHTDSTFRRHYMPSDTVNVLAAHTLGAAQDVVVSSLRHGPTVVSMSAAAAQGAYDLPADARAAATKEENSTVDEKSILPVSCRNEFDSPFGEGLCPTMVSHCMVCPNAFIFEDHIPRMAAYERVLLAHQADMNPADFASRYGLALTNLSAAMDALDPSLVAAARRPTKEVVLNLPIGMRVKLS